MKKFTKQMLSMLIVSAIAVLPVCQMTGFCENAYARIDDIIVNVPLIEGEDDGEAIKIEPSTKPAAAPTTPFENPVSKTYSDVTEGDWFCNAVLYVTSNTLMNGVSDTEFNPMGGVTRGMFATVLFRKNGNIQANLIMPFNDVPSGEYYTEAVRWAAAAKVVNGTSDVTFEPDRLITREEMAAMLYRYIQYRGGGFTGSWAFPLDFPDADQVSDFAYEAMCYLTMPSVGLINGMEDGTLKPKANTNRAELATLLMRYCEAEKTDETESDKKQATDKPSETTKIPETTKPTGNTNSGKSETGGNSSETSKPSGGNTSGGNTSGGQQSGGKTEETTSTTEPEEKDSEGEFVIPSAGIQLPIVSID